MLDVMQLAPSWLVHCVAPLCLWRSQDGHFQSSKITFPISIACVDSFKRGLWITSEVLMMQSVMDWSSCVQVV